MEFRVCLGHSWGLGLHDDEITAALLALGQWKNPQSNPSTLWWWWEELAVSFLVTVGETPATITATQPRPDTWLPAAGPCDQSQPCTFMYWSFSFSSSICLLFIAMFSRIFLLSCVGGREKSGGVRGWVGTGGQTHFSLGVRFTTRKVFRQLSPAGDDTANLGRQLSNGRK